MNHKGFWRWRLWPYESTVLAFVWKILKKTTKNFSQANQCPGQDSNRPPSEYKSRVFFFCPTSLFSFCFVVLYMLVYSWVFWRICCLCLQSQSAWGEDVAKLYWKGVMGSGHSETWPHTRQGGAHALLPTKLDGVTTHKTKIWILTTVRNLDYKFMSVEFYV